MQKTHPPPNGPKRTLGQSKSFQRPSGQDMLNQCQQRYDKFLNFDFIWFLCEQMWQECAELHCVGQWPRLERRACQGWWLGQGVSCRILVKRQEKVSTQNWNLQILLITIFSAQNPVCRPCSRNQSGCSWYSQILKSGQGGGQSGRNWSRKQQIQGQFQWQSF